MEQHEIQSWLRKKAPEWILRQNYIERKIETENWLKTLLLTNAIGFISDVVNHHPEITITYSSLVIRLQTYDSKSITDKDLHLAEKIDDLVNQQLSAYNQA